jgi:hypothetical protein
MCNTVFGNYLHHRPAILSTQVQLDSDFMGMTVKKYTEMFGEADEKFWGKSCCAGGCGDINRV